MAKPTLPHAVMQIVPKRGENDCAIAAMAMYLRRDYEDVLLAAGRVSRNVWNVGLSCPEMVKVAKLLGVKTQWFKTFNLEENEDKEADSGVLWVSYHDVSNEHIVVLDEGKIFDPEHNPVTYWDADDYMRHCAAFGNALLKRVED
jgi:ABC-type bacteriocin/lantibiotic exporter with double-glycine peptidase domain